MEIYLSHMMIYRIIEKAGLIHLFGKNVLSYIFTVAGTLVSTIAFAVAFNWEMKKLVII